MPSKQSQLAQKAKIKVVKNWRHPIKGNAELLKAVNQTFAPEARKVENLIVNYRDQLAENLGQLDQIQCDKEFIVEATKALGLVSRKLNIIRTFSHLAPGTLLDAVIKLKEKINHVISSLRGIQIGIERIQSLIKTINGKGKDLALNEIDKQLQFFKGFENDIEDDHLQSHKLFFNRIYSVLIDFRSCVSQVELPCESIKFVVSEKEYILPICLINIVANAESVDNNHETFPSKKRKISEISVAPSSINSKAEVETEEPKNELNNVWRQFNKIGAAIEATKSEQIAPAQLYDHLTRLTNYLLELDKTYSTIIEMAINRITSLVTFDDEEKLLINLEDLLNSFKANDIGNVKTVCQKLDEHLELVLNVIMEEKEMADENESVDAILCEDEAYNGVADLTYSVGDLEDRLTGLSILVNATDAFVKKLKDQDLNAAQEEFSKLQETLKSAPLETGTSLFCSSLVNLCEKTLENYSQNRPVLSF